MSKGCKTGKGRGRFEESSGMVGKLSQQTEEVGAGRMTDKKKWHLG